MGGFGSALITGAANARRAFSEGQQKAQASAQQSALNNALLMRKIKQEEEQAALARALHQAQVGKLGAETLKLGQPSPTTPEPLEVTVGPDGKRILTPRSKAAGMEAPGPAPTSPEPLEVTVGPDGKRVLTPRSKAAGMEAPSPAPSGQQEDRTLVPVQQEDGSVVYTPRSEAAGMKAPRGQGAGGTERQKRIQALANTEDALKRFETTIDLTGTAYVPGSEKSGLQTEYENLQLQLKEMFNLGVLNGPDLMLMRRVINDPSSLKDLALSAGIPGEHTKRVKAQIAKMRSILEGFKKNLESGNAALTKPATPDGGTGDPEFDALMAKAKKKTP